MKKGDTVYIVRNGVGCEAEVVYTGIMHFMANNCTFKRVDDGSATIGIHARHGIAYTSKEAYQEWAALSAAWLELSYYMQAHSTPPAHLKAADIEALTKLLKGIQE